MEAQLTSGAVNFFQRHIRTDPETLKRMLGNEAFKLFSEVQYHRNKDLRLHKIFAESLEDSSCLHVTSFILSLLHQGMFSINTFIAGIIYLSRFKESTEVSLHTSNWRPLFIISLIVADKVWEDRPVKNSCISKLFPVLSNEEINILEHFFLKAISFKVVITAEVFTNFREKLMLEVINPDIRACVNRSEFINQGGSENIPKASNIKPVMKPINYPRHSTPISMIPQPVLIKMPLQRPLKMTSVLGTPVLRAPVVVSTPRAFSQAPGILRSGSIEPFRRRPVVSGSSFVRSFTPGSKVI